LRYNSEQIYVEHIVSSAFHSDVAVGARAQLVEDFSQSAGNCLVCLGGGADARQPSFRIGNQLGEVLSPDNQRLKAPGNGAAAGRVYGDSITERVELAEYFSREALVNRELAGRTTSQMLVRLFPDVIDLESAVLVYFPATK